MSSYDLIRPAKALGSSIHARTWCESVPTPEHGEDSDTDSEASCTSSMTHSLEMPPYRVSSPPNPQRVNSMGFLQPHYPEVASPVMSTTPIADAPFRRIPLEPVRSTQRGHYPIISFRNPPYLKALEPMLFEAIERCIGASERYIGETIMVGAYYDNYDDVSDDGDDYDEGSGDDDDEWVVIEHEDGEYPWELVGAEEDEDA
ncbi:hypothetical protein LTR91_006227 [Friedmanniomyces endolithicus]|uniref:Uncharacterized protein n=1 Tax=Friedmanniomyces endolithicus TaxID=329885 RepID=A0AAN6QW51_9PEZI|nr:hypothetical protein LTR35_003439 [Friedmanniomyces endolithicus]KAK0294121.1 hypothetical protein LTS00_007462 [Friedmanniomyces endolithicus]KAK0304118.1 hypothetical protein LTR82_017332 [Friedmanniomyces endolithicus]KAK0928983.1 hypothetical protein LTR57_002056 [Friedmanniomyces endolithicus]KAK0978871.1 hypothetical protein LTR54_015773 [Friedmanniomyces endolithicus]